jgi:hypothetical protein
MLHAIVMKLLFPARLGALGLACGLSLGVLAPVRCAAVVLDWSTVSWPTDGSGNPLLSASFDIDPNNPGNDITITISDPSGAFQYGYPTISTTPITGGTIGDSALQLMLNFPDTSSTITVSVQFTYAGKGYAYGVDQAQFSLFDIDNSGGKSLTYVDQISGISAQLGSGSPVAATITNIPGSATYDVANNGTTSATLTGNANNTDTAGNGDATLDFGTNVIDSMTFTYGNGPGVKHNPGQQAIAMFDISYRPRLPEKQPALAAMALCGLVVGLGAVRSRRRRRGA